MSHLLRALVNGVECGQVSVLDRGLHYGDGVFRSLLVEQGMPREWSVQLQKLQHDAARIGLSLPDPYSLNEQVVRICQAEPIAVLKVILTRSASGRGYHPVSTVSNTILLLYPVVEHPKSHWQSGIQVRICDTRLALNPRLAGIKHLGRLEQVLARAEWDNPAIAEGLMLDTVGRLIEGTSSNLFIVQDGVLQTPDLSQCGVAGVMREMILQTAPAYASSVQIRELTPDDLLAAQECFVCNSAIRIWPVARLDNRQWPVGPVTRALQRLLGGPWPIAE